MRSVRFLVDGVWSTKVSLDDIGEKLLLEIYCKNTIEVGFVRIVKNRIKEVVGEPYNYE